MKKIFLLIIVMFIGFSCRIRELTSTQVWRILDIDKNETDSSLYNTDSIFFIKSNDSLKFRLTTYSDWGNLTDSVIIGIYLDTDRDSSTGLNSSLISSGWYSVRDIGADYLIIMKKNDFSLYRWDKNDTVFSFVDTLSYEIESNRAVNISLFSNTLTIPDSLHMIIIMVTHLGTVNEFKDYSPDNINTHYCLYKDSGYISSSSAISKIFDYYKGDLLKKYRGDK